jgi:hypothetical protein
MNNITQFNYNLILNLIELRCPNIRKPKYSNDYYLKNIFHVLEDVISWKSLTKLKSFSYHFHYKTIYSKFLMWNKHNIFKDAFDNIIFFKNKVPNNLPNNILCIDSTNIYNKYGSEYAAYGADKKKRITKLNIVCDNYKNIYSVNIMSGNRHDINGITPSISYIKKTFNYNYIYLLGDKGYNSLHYHNILLNSNIKFITVKKINSKTKLSVLDSSLIKHRYHIECIFQKIKSYNRILIRRDRYTDTYMSFVYLALISIIK